MMMLFMCELILNCEMIPKHMTCSLKYPWRSPDARCSNHTQTNHAPVSLSLSIRFHLPLSRGGYQGGWTRNSHFGSVFFRDSAGTLWEFRT